MPASILSPAVTELSNTWEPIGLVEADVHVVPSVETLTWYSSLARKSATKLGPLTIKSKGVNPPLNLTVCTAWAKEAEENVWTCVNEVSSE